MKRIQFLLDHSLFGFNPWSQEAIELRESLRAQMAQLRGQ